MYSTSRAFWWCRICLEVTLHFNFLLSLIIIKLLVVQACYVRKTLRMSSGWEQIVGASDASDFILKDMEWFKLIEDSKRCAQADLSMLNEQISALGWAAKNILLNTQEQARYSFVDDWKTRIIFEFRCALLEIRGRILGKYLDYFFIASFSEADNSFLFNFCTFHLYITSIIHSLYLVVRPKERSWLRK